MIIRFHRRKKLAALTLMELMIATLISSILLATIMALTSYTARSFAAISNYVTLDRGSRHALDRLSMKIREADGVIDYATNRIRLSYHGAPLIYSYHDDSKTLTETFDGETQVVLRDCYSFTFEIFQRNAVGGSYDYYPATLQTTEAKIVQVTWNCSRRMINNLANSESVQSAKIVIRK
jgi:Tfp pilus assembly protein PilW